MDGKTPRRRRLGRGLKSLLGEISSEPAVHASDSSQHLKEVGVDLIERNPYQPRTEFDDGSMNELTKSIRQHGVLQPLLVRPCEGHYQLIAGERRWLAAKKAGLKTVPCQVRELEDQRVTEAAMEENLKRKDLNVLEKAHAFQDYIDRFGSSIEELAKQLSMTRSNVSNILRLLDLADPIKESLRTERITYGHARALLSLDAADQIALNEQIETQSLSVRQTEAAVRAVLKGETTVPFKPNPDASSTAQPTNHVLSLQEQLRDCLGAKVQIRLQGKESGKIVIPFSSNDEFERIIISLRRAA